ncbi:MAG: hypothetical protein ACKV22_09565 [Bryobacteraceae bacterium]
MRRRDLLKAAPLLAVAPSALGQTAISEPHFPSQLYQFVWRNWELANTGRMAQVLKTSEPNVLALGAAMGLPAKRRLTGDQLRRIYITVIRQNWHLLPEEQIIQLLGWTREKFSFTLKEDDFLDIKLGNSKPKCDPVLYAEPSAEEKQRAAAIRKILRSELGPALDETGEEPFAFIAEYSRPVSKPPRPDARNPLWNPRIIYSFFALYGDALIETETDPFPDGYLAQLSGVGINAVWMQAVLNNLAPAPAFPEFGKDWEKRLRQLNVLIKRADRFGIKLYLYLNEPRAMPASFFTRRPETRGSYHNGVYAMCTSAPAVREWIRASVANVTRHAPGLGGFFTITMSENHTNCYSHTNAWREKTGRVKDCPRCSRREGWEVIADLHQAMQQGIRDSGSQARILAYDWGWSHEMIEKLIPLLPKEVAVLSISEWDQPVSRGGVQTKVGEYSMSVPGPGPRALKSWSIARKHGLDAMAKIQASNTWEISAVPFIPVPPLVLDHCEGLSKAGVSGVLASWTQGGYPSPNLEAASAYYYEKNPDKGQLLRRVAERRYGRAAAPEVVAAWRQFSSAFQEFPYGVHVYVIPAQHGPANLLRLEPTGHRAGMMLFPHDALAQWCGPYPPSVVQSQFSKLSAKWKTGLDQFRAAMNKASRQFAALDLAIAETCLHHFQSVANQVQFYILRERLDKAGEAERDGIRREMAALTRDELRLAKSQYRLLRHHSLLAYEGSNHYYYRPLDAAEKILNCHWLLDRLSRA